jgi:transketolase
MANKLRLESLLSVESAGSGHATTASSVCEILSVLFFDPFVGLRTSLAEPRNTACDKVVLSKGHAAPSYYAAWANIGLFPLENLKHLREFGNDLEGHPTPRLNFVDVATGSLG